jgi:hypothetical protein
VQPADVETCLLKHPIHASVLAPLFIGSLILSLIKKTAKKDCNGIRECTCGTYRSQKTYHIFLWDINIPTDSKGLRDIKRKQCKQNNTLFSLYIYYMNIQYIDL